MAKVPAPIDEVTIKGELTKSGLSLTAKSRAISAFDRLLGGLMDIPAAWLEGKAAKIRGENANQSLILDAEGHAAIEKLNQSQKFGDRLVDAALARQVRRQINVEAVATEAKEALLGAESEPAVEDQTAPEQMDEDWLNMFERYAENASSDNLRKLWGRILAREIRQPKSYSLSTLRFLSELDSDMAALFQKAVTNRLSDGFIIKPPNLENEDLLNFVFLEEVGLLQEVNGNLTQSWEIKKENELRIPIGNLFIFATGVEKNKLGVPVIRITRVGREIASILPSPDMRDVAREVAKALLKEVEHCEIQALIPNPRDPKQILLVSIEKLK